MFHWICPECGREIPPSVRECQACDPHAATSSVVEPIESTPDVEAPAGPPPLPEMVSVPVAEAPKPVPEQLLLVEGKQVAEILPLAHPPVPLLHEAPVNDQTPEPVAVKPLAEPPPVAEPVVETPAVAEAAPVEGIVE